jgi:hypothetical protein
VIGAIDWSRPWLAPLRELGEPMAARIAGGASVAAALGERFVAQHDLPRGEAYEAFIARCGRVPTRDNLHDFFAGLAWHHHPALKSRLNALQAAEIACRGVGPRRGPLRDALTRFDEHGLLLDAPPALWQALRERDWLQLFVGRRALWRQARLTVFGHALLEQLARAPRKALTGFVFAAGDATAADAARWAAAPLLPLPVLGVPGWWPGNEDPAFYADADVFRPAKSPDGAGPGRAAGLKAAASP